LHVWHWKTPVWQMQSFVPRLPGGAEPAGRSGPQPLRQLGSTPTVQVVTLSFNVDGHRLASPVAPASPVATGPLVLVPVLVGLVVAPVVAALEVF
jgi:hypothetical protein